MCYNILEPSQIKDDLQLQHKKEEDQKKRRGHRMFYEKEREMRLRDLTTAHIHSNQSLSRAHPKRFSHAADRGYDLITNEPLHGRDAKVTFPSFAPTPVVMHEKVQEESKQQTTQNTNESRESAELLARLKNSSY